MADVFLGNEEGKYHVGNNKKYEGKMNIRSKEAMIETIKYLASHIPECVTEVKIRDVEARVEEEEQQKASNKSRHGLMGIQDSLSNHITYALDDISDSSNLTVDFEVIIDQDSDDSSIDSRFTNDFDEYIGEAGESREIRQTLKDVENSDHTFPFHYEEDYVSDSDLSSEPSTSSDTSSYSDFLNYHLVKQELKQENTNEQYSIASLSQSFSDASQQSKGQKFLSIQISTSLLLGDCDDKTGNPSCKKRANTFPRVSNSTLRESSKLLWNSVTCESAKKESSHSIRGISKLDNVRGSNKSICSSMHSGSDSETVVKLRQSRLSGLSIGSATSMEEDMRSRGSSLCMQSVCSSLDEIVQAAREVQSALLFVDISGFTVLAKSVEIEPFSQVINSYFQLIVEEIEVCGGDVLKFAGDALIAEWKVPNFNRKRRRPTLPRINRPISAEDAAFRAASCAAGLVDKCSDFPVVVQNQEVTKLNIHCGIGFGNTVGIHVGNTDRMEYLVLGESVQQCTKAVNIAKLGEVAISVEALRVLLKSASMDESYACNPNCEGKAQIIASKSKRFFEPRKGIAFQSSKERFLERIVKKCNVLNFSALELLQKEMLPYAHPVVSGDFSNSELFSSENRDRCVDENRLYQSEAELRDVVTLFIQPIVDLTLTGNEEDDIASCEVLNQIMVLVNSEVTRFKGQLRQFIADDKGLVIIVNFGLRGSTFPNLIEERALPCVKAVKILLATELGVECKIGVTYGRAYCGVVGATFRHEYAVLGRSVNLAARLMSHSKNPGILVDEAVVQKAGNAYPFEPLTPIVAKGYSEPVKIYKPQAKKTTKENQLVARQCDFIGREKEIETISLLADNAIASKACNLVFIFGQYGIGKSTLLSLGCRRICTDFASRSIPCIFSSYSFSDDDSFRPFSIVHHLFLDIFLRQNNTSNSSFNEPNQNVVLKARLYVNFLQLCMEAGIPGEYVELLGGLIFTNKLSDIGKWSERSQHISEWITIAMYVVKVFNHYNSKTNQLVLLALDDVSGMDEMSWKIISLLYENVQNLLVVATSRNHFEMNIQTEFWNVLNDNGIETGRFVDLNLSPFDQIEVKQLVTKVLGRKKEYDKDDQINKISKSIYKKSRGNPLMASEILEKLYKNSKWVTSTNVGNIGEVLLNRLDSLSHSARSYLHLGALIGASFEIYNVAAIMQKYHNLEQRGAMGSLTKNAQESLEEAVEFGIVDVEGSTYIFSHQFWRENILARTLDSWKYEMQCLINEIKTNKEQKHTFQNYAETNEAENWTNNSIRQHLGRETKDKCRSIFSNFFNYSEEKKGEDEVIPNQSSWLENTETDEDNDSLCLVHKLQQLNDALVEIEHSVIASKEEIIRNKEEHKQVIKMKFHTETLRDLVHQELIKKHLDKKIEESEASIKIKESEESENEANIIELQDEVKKMSQSNEKLNALNVDRQKMLSIMVHRNKILEERTRDLNVLHTKYQEAISREMHCISICQKYVAYEQRVAEKYSNCIDMILELLNKKCSIDVKENLLKDLSLLQKT